MRLEASALCRCQGRLLPGTPQWWCWQQQAAAAAAENKSSSSSTHEGQKRQTSILATPYTYACTGGMHASTGPLRRILLAKTRTGMHHVQRCTATHIIETPHVPASSRSAAAAALNNAAQRGVILCYRPCCCCCCCHLSRSKYEYLLFRACSNKLCTPTSPLPLLAYHH
jgi:hypothetical protein